MLPEYLQKLLQYRGKIHQENFEFGKLRIENPNISPVFLRSENLEIGGMILTGQCPNCNIPFKSLYLGADIDVIYVGITAFYDPKSDLLLITHITKEEYHNWKELEPKHVSRVNKTLGTQSFYFAKYFPLPCYQCNYPIPKKHALSFADFHNQGGTIITWDIFPE